MFSPSSSIMESTKITTFCARKLLILAYFLSFFVLPSEEVINFKPSPCPDTFTYEQTQEDTDRWFGDISLKVNQTADGVIFRITLDRPAQLLVVSSLQSYTAETTTTDNRIFNAYYSDAELIRGTVYKGRIMVKFDINSPVPMLESLHLNGVRVCPFDPAILSIIPGSTHTNSYTPELRPDPPNTQFTESTTIKNRPTTSGSNQRPHTSGSNSGSWNKGTTSKTTEAFNPNNGGHGFDVTTNKGWSKSTPRPTVATVTSSTNSGHAGGGSKPSNNQSNGGATSNEYSNPNNIHSGNPNSNNGIYGGFTNNPEGDGEIFTGGDSGSNHGGSIVPCGTVSVANPLVTKGQKTHHGQWPWHIALYKTEGINLSYLCGGSLIAKNKVLTAAHCLVSNPGNKILNFKSLVVYLGKYNLKQYTGETGVQTKEVSNMKINPSYNSSNFQGDLAILTLSSNVEYTNYVRPVCLWESAKDISDIENKEGVIAGWGLTENDQTSEELKMATLPVVSTTTCIRSHPKFYAEYLSETSFCAGFRNGTSPCNGDSGGGLVFKRQNNTWYLRGIVSLSVAKEGLSFCDPNYYVIFTDTARYVDFIKKNSS